MDEKRDATMTTQDENLPEHREDYGKFIWWLKFGAVASAITAIIVILLIS